MYVETSKKSDDLVCATVYINLYEKYTDLPLSIAISLLRVIESEFIEITNKIYIKLTL